MFTPQRMRNFHDVFLRVACTAKTREKEGGVDNMTKHIN